MDENLPANKNTISEILWKTFQGLAEGLTGIAASDRKDILLSIGYLFQRMRGGEFLRDFFKTWEHFREKGRIKEDYAHTEQCQASIQEILDFLDKDSPDEIRFSFLKKLFLSIATENLSDRGSVLPQQYIRIVRTLSSGAILLLLASFRVAKNDMATAREFGNWMAKVKEYSGLRHDELIVLYDQELTSKKLILDRGITMSIGKHHRLTSLGYEICRFIEHYEQEEGG